MATMRESLMKLAEVAKPVPGDEQEFVAKHVIKTFDLQGKDSISQESPYELILKNVASIKAPGQPGKDDHGHDAPGESEKAYHIPESRDAKIAKLAEMMNGKDEKEDEDEEEEEDEDEEDEDEEDEDEDEDEEDEKEVKEAKKEVVGVKMHYHNPKTGEKFHEVHFSVPAAEKFRKQHEKSGFKLVKKEAQFNEEMKPLLPGQKKIARDLLAKEMQKRKEERNAKRQAGTPKLSEEGTREANDAVRMARVSTARPNTPETVEGMRHRLQTVKKQIIDKT